MNRAFILIVLFILGAGAAWYFSVRQDARELELVTVQPPQRLELLPTPAEPAVFPIENVTSPAPAEESAPVAALEPEPDPLPALENSDPEILDQAAGLIGPEALQAYFVTEFVISRLVSTVDSLTSDRVAPLMLPTRPVQGRFMVLEADGEAVISPENARRYDGLVALAGSVGVEPVVGLYVRYYPLFQKAYLELGYEGRHFNDRLVEVLDHLLLTPEPRGLIPVVQNEAVYEYQDERLEGLSAGQKALIRIGEDNGQEVRVLLRALRKAVRGESLSASTMNDEKNGRIRD